MNAQPDEDGELMIDRALAVVGGDAKALADWLRNGITCEPGGWQKGRTGFVRSHVKYFADRIVIVVQVQAEHVRRKKQRTVRPADYPNGHDMRAVIADAVTELATEITSRFLGRGGS